ncbi:MAG: ABC transporter permease [Cytophagales bacterium]|nr:ABC transporter permease [Cytophagales bacterium]MDW8384570.1 ABC transporter permease [Flammeovirgaceae bacterium]
MSNLQDEKWDLIIKPHESLVRLNISEIWAYRDLLMLLVRRDFVSVYKQTIFGPVWFFIQPALTTFTYVLIFNNIAGLSTDGIPPILFYMSGVAFWNYFAECFNRTSTTFRDNAPIFGKVYFPRLVIPLSIVISNLTKLGIQLLLFLIFYVYFLFKTDSISPQWHLFPVVIFLILLLAGLGLGFGLIITALTNKYRDLMFLVTFGIQLLMYATPVIYPLSSIPEKYKNFILANPLSPVMEAFRAILLGTGSFEWLHIGYSTLFTIVLLLIGIIIFNYTERDFMDTV